MMHTQNPMDFEVTLPAVESAPPAPDDTADNRKYLSYTQLAAWQRCPQMWHYKYGMGLTPVYTRRALQIGVAVHKGIHSGLVATMMEDGSHDIGNAGWEKVVSDAVVAHANKYIAERPDLTPEQIMETTEVGHTGAALALRALRFLRLPEWKTMFLTKKGENRPLVEARLEIPLSGWDGYTGYVDWVAHHVPTSTTWLVDHKVREQFQDDSNEEVNLQMAAYQYALARHGVNAVGSLCFQIRNRLPEPPKLLKDGSFSRARIACDWDTYAITVANAQQSPAVYEEEMRPKLDYEFFRLSRAFRTKKEIQNTWKQIIVRGGYQIARKQKHIYRVMGQFTCGMGCDYRDLCLEQLRGRDTQFIEERYIKRVNSPTSTTTKEV